MGDSRDRFDEIDELLEERFFEFMAKREKLRLTKESGAPWPWSDDPILNAYKFTNVKREHDRTTRWMRWNWTRPNENRPHGEIIFNCALFRYFGTSEFAGAVGWQTDWNASSIIDIAARRIVAKERVFTGAYIIPTLGESKPKHEVVCKGVLTPLWSVKGDLAHLAQESQSWETVGRRMMTLPGFGGTGFMTKEVLQDVMQTPVLRNAKDRNTWCPAGPGARRGLNRLYDRALAAGIKEAQLLSEMISLFEKAPRYLPDFMPELELHDIQFQLCEFDKYERVRLGEGRPKSKYRPPIS